MRITVELDWDAEINAFCGAWNGRKVELPADDVARLGGSAFEAEAKYDQGGLQIIGLVGKAYPRRYVLARTLLGRGNAAEALAELAQVREQVVAVDPLLRSARAHARAWTGDVPGAIADIHALLDAELGREPMGRVADALKQLPPDAARPLMPRFCARLGALESPLTLARCFPDSFWTRESILDALRASAAATVERPWIVEELEQQARRMGASDAALSDALGSTAAVLDRARDSERQRILLAAQHVQSCLDAATAPDPVARMLALLHRLNGGDAPELVAAIELDHPDLTTSELADLRAEIRVDIGPPASAADIEAMRAFVRDVVGQPLPADYESFLAAADGLRLGWSDDQLLSAAEITACAGQAEDPPGIVQAVLPFAQDDHGHSLALMVGPGGDSQVAEMDRGKLCSQRPALAFSDWFCRFIAAGLSLTGSLIVTAR